MPQTTSVERKPNTAFLEVQVINLAEISRLPNLRAWGRAMPPPRAEIDAAIDAVLVARPLP